MLVIVSRGSQADLVDDQFNPDTVTSDNGADEPLDEQASSANASVALMVDSSDGLKTPPPSGHVNYENDLHDTNNSLYAVEGSGEGPGELTDGITPEVESQTDLSPKSGEITPRRLSPLEQVSQDDESAGNAEPLVTPDAIDKPAPKNGPDVAPRASTPAVPNPGNEQVLEGYPKWCRRNACWSFYMLMLTIKSIIWSMPSFFDVLSVNLNGHSLINRFCVMVYQIDVKCVSFMSFLLLPVQC